MWKKSNVFPMAQEHRPGPPVPVAATTSELHRPLSRVLLTKTASLHRAATVGQAPRRKCVLSSSLSRKTKRRVSSFPFCRQGDGGSKSLNYILKAARLPGERTSTEARLVELQSQGSWLPVMLLGTCSVAVLSFCVWWCCFQAFGVLYTYLFCIY